MGYDPPGPPAPWPDIHIGAVTVCVNFGDFLAWTLPHNRAQFDEWVVVTSTGDKKTAMLCDHYHVRCVKTDVFFTSGKAFDKAAGINAGLDALSKKSWVVQMDADIQLPPRAKEMLGRSQPNDGFIYGIDRVNVPNFEDYINFMCHPEQQYVSQIFVQQNAFDMGSRLVIESGYVPIGFFQMWNPQGSGISRYSEEHDFAADHSDVTHAQQWPRARRGFIPEIIALHLGSEMDEENGNGGTNWRGRVSKPFRPSK